MLTALVIGLGQIGLGYDLKLDAETFVLTHSRAFQQHLRFSLVGGVDPNPERCKLFEDNYGCLAYSTIESACQNLRPDIIVISTPTNSHYQDLKTVLDVSLPKSIICEKPISYDVTEANRMVDLCAKCNCRLYVNYMRRSEPGAIEVKKRLTDSSISFPVKGIAWYSKGIFHNGSHIFNLLQFWLGDVRKFKILQKGRLWNKIDPEPDILVSFERGAIYFLAANEEDFSHYTIELVASNGRLRYEQGGNSILWQEVISNPTCDGYRILTPVEEMIQTDMHRYQWNVVQQIARDIDGVEANVCSGLEALQTLRSLDEIRSMI